MKAVYWSTLPSTSAQPSVSVSAAGWHWGSRLRMKERQRQRDRRIRKRQMRGEREGMNRLPSLFPLGLSSTHTHTHTHTFAHTQTLGMFQPSAFCQSHTALYPAISQSCQAPHNQLSNQWEEHAQPQLADCGTHTHTNVVLERDFT